MQEPRSETPDANAHGTPADLHDVTGHLTRVASLVIQARESLQSNADGNPHDTRRLIEELGCLVGETIQLTRASASDADRDQGDDEAIGTFCPGAYVAGHVAKLAELLKRPDRFTVTLHPDCADARIRMHRADLMRVLAGLLRSADQWSDGSEPVELDLDIVDSSHPLAARGRTLPAGRYFSFRVSGKSLAASTRAGRSNPGIDLGRASRLVTEVRGGLRYHHGPDGRTTREAVIPLCWPQGNRDDLAGLGRDQQLPDLDQRLA